MKLLTDENISVSVAKDLKEHGHNVLDVKESNLVGASDAHLLTLAQTEKRLIVTHDKDFITLIRLHPHPPSAVIILPANQRPQQVLQRLQSLFSNRKLLRKKVAHIYLFLQNQLQIYQVK